jgi:hypothetical protein
LIHPAICVFFTKKEEERFYFSVAQLLLDAARVSAVTENRNKGGQMKKTALAILITGLFLCGFALADPGVPPVQEVQGLSIQTTVIAVGNFDQESEVVITSSSGSSLSDVPPLGPSSTYYQSVYTEDTHSAGIGYISFDKDLNVDTSAKTNGQYNIESVRQISYLGIDAGSIYSSEYLMTSGSGTSQDAAGRMICPFGSESTIGAFCNKVESGSTFTMSVANVATQANTRFITKSADSPVELNYNILVTDYASGLPSKGSVEAYIKGTIKEGSNSNPDTLGEDSSFEDRTSIIGDISLFDKQMHYDSSFSP